VLGRCETCYVSFLSATPDTRRAWARRVTCQYCGCHWCGTECAEAMACLHKSGGCVSEEWRAYYAAAEEALNEYFILAARMHFKFEAALRRRRDEEGGGAGCAERGGLKIREGGGSGSGSGRGRGEFRGQRTKDGKKVPWAVMRGVNWALTLGLDDDLAAQAGMRDLTKAQADRLRTFLPLTSKAGYGTSAADLGRLMGLLRQNVQGTYTSDGQEMMALFLVQSTCNHECDPNARMTWSTTPNETTKDQFVTPHRPCVAMRATRSIAQGEEIYIDYIGAGAPEGSDERAEKLREQYGFKCQCWVCRC